MYSPLHVAQLSLRAVRAGRHPTDLVPPPTRAASAGTQTQQSRPVPRMPGFLKAQTKNESPELTSQAYLVLGVGADRFQVHAAGLYSRVLPCCHKIASNNTNVLFTPGSAVLPFVFFHFFTLPRTAWMDNGPCTGISWHARFSEIQTASYRLARRDNQTMLRELLHNVWKKDAHLIIWRIIMV